MRGTRMALATAVAVLGIAVAPGAAQAAESWTQVGGTISPAPVETGQYDIKRIAGAPHIAYTDTSGAVDQVRVVRLSSSGTWVSVGGPLNIDPAVDARGPSLVAGPGDVPWISWLEEDDGMVRVRVARYDAATGRWVEVAPNSVINRITGPEPGMSSAVQTKIVFVDGRAHVIFRQENPSAYEVGHVRLSADGDSWERLAGLPVRSEPYFVTAHVTGGVLYAAMRDYLGGVYVLRYTDAGTWQQLGVMANPVLDGQPVPTYSTALASYGGVIYVAHSLSEVASPVYVTRFVNGSWETVGGILGEGTVSSLRVIGGRLYVGWTQATAARTARLNAAGTAWGDTVPFPAGVRSPVLTGIGGVPHAAVIGPDGRLEAYRLDGTSPAGPDDSDDSEPPKPQPQTCGKERVGTRYGDRLTGTSARETIRGLGGNDRISGLGGADCLFGDAGDDRIEGGEGEDVIDGGTGDDRLIGGNGNDTVTGGSGDDVIDSRGKGYDTIDCGPGYDRALVGDLDRVRNCERVQNVD